MFPLIAMLIFILIAALGLFHVLIVKATAWGFVAWFVALVVYNMTRKEPKTSTAEPNLDKVFPLSYKSPIEYSESHVPPQGGDATVPVISPKETHGGGQSTLHFSVS